jgi:hypothetical protein
VGDVAAVAVDYSDLLSQIIDYLVVMTESLQLLLFLFSASFVCLLVLIIAVVLSHK